MPTYTNTSSSSVSIGDTKFDPNETKVMYNYIDLALDVGGNITLDSHSPHWNPVIGNTSIVGTNETVIHTCNLDASYIRIIYVSGTVNVYINATDNTPAITIKESITLKAQKKILYLHFVFSGTGEVLVQENI